MSTSWNGQICNDEGKYYIQFETDNKELYRLIEKACQNVMDIAYPREERPPKYKSICKICGKAVFHEDITSDGICVSCDNKLEKTKYTEEEFIEKYCRNCGSQRCEGIGTEWFDGCHYRDNLRGYKNGL